MKKKFKKMFLKYTFTDAEQRDNAMVMAEKTQELKEVDQLAKSAAAQFKSDKERVQSEIDQAARKYKDGYEMRDIECEEIPNFDEGLVRYYRTDNGELAQVRQMTGEERQMRLDEIEVEKELNPPALPAPDEDADLAHEMAMAATQRTMSQERAVHQ